jgi:hypothetical protein
VPNYDATAARVMTKRRATRQSIPYLFPSFLGELDAESCQTIASSTESLGIHVEAHAVPAAGTDRFWN